jgi:hypothetical protein
MKAEPSFWDTSALVPICVQQAPSKKVRQFLQSSLPVVWWGTPVEIHSAIARMYRDRVIDAAEKDGAAARAAIIAQNWKEILPADPLRELARDLLDSYPLRAADSLQLAAALTWCRKHPRGKTFVCGDQRLLQAASSAGFSIVEVT